VVFEAKVALSALASIPLIGAGAAATTIAPPARTYSIPLTAEAEVNSIHPSGATGDTDGSGVVELTVDPQRKRICYAFRLSGVATPLMAHIHKGPPPAAARRWSRFLPAPTATSIVWRGPRNGSQRSSRTHRTST
jgi:hypothetical protein